MEYRPWFWFHADSSKRGPVIKTDKYSPWRPTESFWALIYQFTKRFQKIHFILWYFVSDTLMVLSNHICVIKDFEKSRSRKGGGKDAAGEKGAKGTRGGKKDREGFSTEPKPQPLTADIDNPEMTTDKGGIERILKLVTVYDDPDYGGCTISGLLSNEILLHAIKKTHLIDSVLRHSCTLVAKHTGQCLFSFLHFIVTTNHNMDIKNHLCLKTYPPKADNTSENFRDLRTFTATMMLRIVFPVLPRSFDAFWKKIQIAVRKSVKKETKTE